MPLDKETKLNSIRFKFCHLLLVFNDDLNPQNYTFIWLQFNNMTYVLILPLRSCNVIYKALCFDVAQGRMNGAPNETAFLCTPSWRHDI